MAIFKYNALRDGKNFRWYPAPSPVQSMPAKTTWDDSAEEQIKKGIHVIAIVQAPRLANMS